MKHLSLALAVLALSAFAPAPMLRASQILDGITVSGSVNTTTPATSAVLTLGVTARDHATPLGRSDLAPLADALVQAGIQRSNIQLPPYLSADAKSRFVSVTVTIDHPTLSSLRSGTAVMTKFLLATPTLWIESANVQLSSANCTQAERQAEDEAVQQARWNAERIAQIAGVQAGAPLAIDAQHNDGYGRLSCEQQYPIVYPGAIMPLHEYLTIPMYRRVTIRYAIVKAAPPD